MHDTSSGTEVRKEWKK